MKHTHNRKFFFSVVGSLAWKLQIIHLNRSKVKVNSLSHVRLFATPWTVAYQAPPSIGFSRQEYWSGLPFPSPGDLPDPGIEPRSPTFQADALTSEPPGKFQVKGSEIVVQSSRWSHWDQEIGSGEPRKLSCSGRGIQKSLKEWRAEIIWEWRPFRFERNLSTSTTRDLIK